MLFVGELYRAKSDFTAEVPPIVGNSKSCHVLKGQILLVLKRAAWKDYFDYENGDKELLNNLGLLKKAKGYLLLCGYQKILISDDCDVNKLERVR